MSPTSKWPSTPPPPGQLRPPPCCPGGPRLVSTPQSPCDEPCSGRQDSELPAGRSLLWLLNLRLSAGLREPTWVTQNKKAPTPPEWGDDHPVSSRTSTHNCPAMPGTLQGDWDDGRVPCVCSGGLKQIYSRRLGCQVFYHSLEMHRKDPKTTPLVRNVWSSPGGEAQGVGVYPQKVAGSIPIQGTYLGRGGPSQVAGVSTGDKRSMFLSHINVFLSLFLPLPSSLSKINIFSFKNKY